MRSEEKCLERLFHTLDAAVSAGCGHPLAPSTWAAGGPLLARLARPALLRQAEATLAGALRWGPGADERLAVIALALVERLAESGGRLLALSQSGNVLTAVLDDGEEPVSPLAFAHWVAALSYALFGEEMQGRLAAPVPAGETRTRPAA